MNNEEYIDRGYEVLGNKIFCAICGKKLILKHVRYNTANGKAILKGSCETGECEHTGNNHDWSTNFLGGYMKCTKCHVKFS